MEVKIKKKNNGSESIVEAFPLANDLENSLEWIREQGITHININKYHGWEEGIGLDFLENHKWIKGLWIVDEKLDLSPVNHLNNLESFGYSGDVYTGFVDFLNFPKLKILVYDWDQKNLLHFESLKELEVLNLYKWPYGDLRQLDFAANLVKLEMNFSKKLTSLVGIDHFKKLSWLSIYSAPKLENVADLIEVSDSLRKLSLELVKNVNDFAVLDGLVNLEAFYVAKSTPIHSIQWLKKLKNLKYACVDTKVLDGDVEFLKMKGFKYKKVQNK